jgi:hypothetical protein
MSFPGKEALVTLEELAKQQTQIWPDSYDFGLRLTGSEIGGNLQRTIHDACVELAKIYKNKKSKWVLGVGWECFIPFEMEGEDYVGVIVKVSLNGMYQRGVKFFTIDFSRHHQQEDPFKGE